MIDSNRDKDSHAQHFPDFQFDQRPGGFQLLGVETPPARCALSHNMVVVTFLVMLS